VASLGFSGWIRGKALVDRKEKELRELLAVREGRGEEDVGGGGRGRGGVSVCMSGAGSRVWGVCDKGAQPSGGSPRGLGRYDTCFAVPAV
jgi:hypothetical protein